MKLSHFGILQLVKHYLENLKLVQQIVDVKRVHRKEILKFNRQQQQQQL
jgi:hypothetical protein